MPVQVIADDSIMGIKASSVNVEREVITLLPVITLNVEAGTLSAL